MRNKVQVLPNVITAFGLSCGLFVIFRMNMINLGEVTPYLLTTLTGLLLLAAVADLLDGAVARVIKAESDFGGTFDCIADAITFGVCPSVMILKTLSASPGSALSFLLTGAAMVYSVCGVLRLVRFHVMSLREKDDETLQLANKKNFTGLPIPAAAAAAVSCNLLLISEEFNSLFTLSEVTRAGILSAVLVILGYFMVSRWKFPSLKTLHIRVRSFQVVIITVVAAVVIFYGALNHFPVMFFTLSWFYVAIASILSLIRLITGSKSSTLEDFEPEPESEEDL